MKSLEQFFQILSNHKAALSVLMSALTIFVLLLIATCTHLGIKYEIMGYVDMKIAKVEFKISSDRTALPGKKNRMPGRKAQGSKGTGAGTLSFPKDP